MQGSLMAPQLLWFWCMCCACVCHAVGQHPGLVHVETVDSHIDVHAGGAASTDLALVCDRCIQHIHGCHWLSKLG
jgi:hypothetical protein